MKFNPLNILILSIGAFIVAITGAFGPFFLLYQQSRINEMALASTPLTLLSPPVVEKLGVPAAMISQPLEIKPDALRPASRVAAGCYYVQASISPAWKPSLFRIDDDGKVSLGFSAYGLSDGARQHMLSRCQAATKPSRA